MGQSERRLTWGESAAWPQRRDAAPGAHPSISAHLGRERWKVHHGAACGRHSGTCRCSRCSLRAEQGV